MISACLIALVVLAVIAANNLPTGGLGLSSVTVTQVIGGSGSNLVTVTVQTGGGAAIEGVNIQIWDSTNSTYITAGTTNDSGEKVFALDAGTYAVRLMKTGYSFTMPETLTVAGDTSATYTGSAFSIDVPGAAETCRVYEYCYDQEGGNPVSSVTGTARIVDLPYDYGGRLHFGDKVTGTYSSDTGIIYWDIARGATVFFDIPDFGVKTTKVVPDLATARLTDIS
jgi:hypothetical protein